MRTKIAIAKTAKHWTLLLLVLSVSAANAQPVTPDPGFSPPDGKEFLPIPISEEYFSDMVVDGQGRQIYVGATSQDGDEGGNSRGIAMRLKPDGTRDNTWGVDGVVFVDFPASNDQFFGVALDNNNNVIICGRTNVADAALFKLRSSNGSLDNAFGTGGRVVFPAAREFNDVAVLPDQRIIAVGWGEIISNQDNNYIVARFMSNGSVDGSFGTNNGYTHIDFEDDDYANHLAVEADGDLVVAGKSQTCTSANCEDMSIVKLKANGQIDLGFGPSGTGKILWKTAPHEDEAFIYNLLLQNIQGEEHIILAGRHEPQTDEYAGFIWRMRNNGNTESWGGSSIGFVSLPEAPYVFAALQGDKLVLTFPAVSFSGSNIFSTTKLTRRKSDGTLDPGFDSDGYCENQVGAYIDLPQGVRTYGNKIYVFGAVSADANFGPDYDAFVIRFVNGTATAVAEPEWAKQLAVYPNPASEVAYVRLDMPAITPLTFSIGDLMGRVVWQSQIQAGAGVNQIEIPLGTSLPAGQYSLRIASDESAITRFIVVK